jgi:hypothetical protein
MALLVLAFVVVCGVVDDLSGGALLNAALKTLKVLFWIVLVAVVVLLERAC